MSTSQEQLKFIEYDAPAITAGDYEITVEQKLGIDGGKTFTRSALFSIFAKRFRIDPSDIYAQFPPAENLGEYSDCLPHLSFTGTTFPWQRYALAVAAGDDDAEPWLALVLFDEDEMGDVYSQVVSLEDLVTNSLGNGDGTVSLENGDGTTSSYDYKFPGVALETGQSKTDKAIVIDVKKSLLEAIVPSYEALKLLAHVRQKTKEVDTSGVVKEEVEQEVAVVVCNRFPRPEARSTVHLVSMEGRYDPNTNNAFDDGGASPDDYIRLVSLKSWSFSCLSTELETFEELIGEIDSGPLRFPENENDNTAEAYLQRGYLPLRYRIRDGSKTVAWYHGPLAVAAASETLDSYVEDSDQLIRYHEGIGLFDVGYGCAMELGRLLGLRSQTFASALYNWKRVQKQQTQHHEIEATLERTAQDLGIDVSAAGSAGSTTIYSASASSQWQTQIIDWFDRLNLLYYIPFNYLVPYASMLPEESIRFFTLDRYWQDCVQYGAFTLGRVTNTNLDNEKGRLDELKKLMDHEYTHVSGFLLRSQLVSGWPDLKVKGYNKADLDVGEAADSDALPILRMETLASNVLLCLFEGDAQTVDIYLEAQGLQFGVDGVDESSGTIYKTIDIAGIVDDQDNPVTYPIEITAPVLKSKRVVDIVGLADALKDDSKLAYLIGAEMTSADIGMLMIEGSTKGRFVQETSP